MATSHVVAGIKKYIKQGLYYGKNIPTPGLDVMEATIGGTSHPLL